MAFKQTPIAEMNKRISMQSLDSDLESSLTGEPIRSYTEYAVVWAKIRTLSGRERNAAQQVQATMSHELTVRYSSDVSGAMPTDRVVYGSRIFDVKDVRNIDEANIEIRMLCVETAD